MGERATSRKASAKARNSRAKVRRHRARLRRLGLRPIQLWVPDTRRAGFAAEARRQAARGRRSGLHRVGGGLERDVTRGEIWTVAGAGIAGKPRPALIVQDDRFAATTSVTVIGFTADPTDAPLLRPLIAADAANGLQRASRVMIDKMVTVRRDRLGRRVGRLAAADMVRVERALAVFLGLAA